MNKFYQSEWHGIYFDEFSEPSKTKLPDSKFYDNFYEHFFKKFSNYDDLDKSWVDYKIDIATYINSLIHNKSNILSIGSGIGIVEDFLSKTTKDIKVHAIEPSTNASRWLKKNNSISVYNGYFPDCLDKNLKFDLVYANNIDYIFNDNEYAAFLKSVVDYGIKDFLIITSAKYNMKIAIKSFLKNFTEYRQLSKKQLWGYLRTVKDQKRILNKTGFKNIKITKFRKDSLIIRASI